MIMGAWGIGRKKSPSTPTAASYVQDGLIAMWDGIENAGWGTHDDYATTWKDLIGSNDAAVKAGGSFGTSSLICDGTGIGAQDGSSIDSFRTMEVCLKDTGALACFVAVVSSGNGNGVLIVKANLSFGFGYYSGTFFYPPTQAISSGATISGLWDANPASNKENVAYVNGAQITRSQTEIGPGFGSGTKVTFGARQDAARPFTGDIYCVRLYSRALTAAEIAANYAVDAQRFNLSS